MKGDFPFQKDGYFDLPTGVGLGVELDEEALIRYPAAPSPHTEGYLHNAKFASRQQNHWI